MSLNISPDIATYAEQQHADEICRQRQFHEHEQPHRVDIRCHQRFTMFSQLPPEIRDMIWELAIHDCDAQPKAHWFSLQRCADNAGYPTPSLYTSYEPMESDHEGRIHPNSDQQRRQSLTYLKIPSFNTPPKDDQLDEVCDQWDRAGNVSAYINTCALWTACPESCAAMIRQWRKDAHVRGNDARQVKLIKFETGHASPFHLIDMQQDVLAIKAPEISAVLAQSILHLAKGGFCGSTVRNIGLEFHVEWDNILRLGSHGTGWEHFTNNLKAEGSKVAKLASRLTNETAAQLWLLDTTRYSGQNFLSRRQSLNDEV